MADYRSKEHLDETRSSEDVLKRISWAAIAIGAMAALGLIMVTFLLLSITGLVDSPLAIGLLFLQLLGLVVAGYVSGRLSGESRVVHGSLAALSVSLVTSTIALAAGAAPGLGVLFFGIALAAVLGSVGGAVAEWQIGN